MEMWMIWCIVAFVGFIMLEEAIYYFWNRYVYAGEESRNRFKEIKELFTQLIDKHKNKKSHSL